jgi:hypothetical protein
MLPWQGQLRGSFVVVPHVDWQLQAPALDESLCATAARRERQRACADGERAALAARAAAASV